MKAVCSKHVQAYEVSAGCPYCEPVPERLEDSALAPVPSMAMGLAAPVALNDNLAPSSAVLPPQEGFDTRKLTVDDMMRLARFYAL